MQSVNELSAITLKDIVDAAEKVANPSEKGKGHYLGGSISNYTKNLIMTFPCMCDDSLSASTASMISRANERNIVTMLHMLFSSINMTTSKDAIDIIRGIHNNIKTNYTLDDYMDTMDDIMTYSESVFTKAKEKAIVMEMMKSIREAKSFPISSLEEDSSLMDFEVRGNGNSIMTVREAKKEEKEKFYPHSTTRKSPVIDGKPTDGGDVSSTSQHYTYKSIDPDEEDDTPDDLDYKKKKQDVEYGRQRNNREKEKFSDDKKDRMARAQNDLNNLFTKRLLDSDVRKSNEMQPALMIINYNQVNPNNQQVVGQFSFVAGVKSRLIPVESQDIMDRIYAKNKTKVNFKNFIRATTGEISFVKDFLLCINQAKIDAKNASKKGLAATMWKTLENRSIKNTWNKIRRSSNDASAITVLVISQETVNALIKYYNIDISKVKTAKEIMDTYNLMGIIIADDSLEIAKFLYAGNDNWDQQAYSFLEKEASGGEYKKMVNLLNKALI
jgi:hypothetical protein